MDTKRKERFGHKHGHTRKIPKQKGHRQTPASSPTASGWAYSGIAR